MLCCSLQGSFECPRGFVFMLKPKGLSQDALVRLSCGGALEHFQLRRPAFPFSFLMLCCRLK